MHQFFNFAVNLCGLDLTGYDIVREPNSKNSRLPNPEIYRANYTFLESLFIIEYGMVSLKS